MVLSRSGNRAKRLSWMGPCFVLVATLVAYCNSFRGPFVYDDILAIRNNPRIHTLVLDFTGDRRGSTLSGRPMLQFTFALDYAIAGLQVTAYHVTNLLVHLAAAALVYAITRRTLLQRRVWGDRFETSATWLASSVAAIWAVHPLNTIAVTFLAQRAESLASVFYLAVIYCLIRSGAADLREELKKGKARNKSANPSGLWAYSPAYWQIAGVLACILGWECKEILATAPLVAWFYDRTFLAGSFRKSLELRWRFYLGLVATWLILPSQMYLTHWHGGSVGANFGVSSMDYFRTQLGVIAHYLHQAIWPAPWRLVLDEYGWPITRRWRDIGSDAMVPISLGLATLAALRWRPVLGFLGAWFFLILAPSSSFVPLATEVAAEHRMYLPLLALIVPAVVGGWMLLRTAPFRWMGASAMVLIVVVFCSWTMQRNAVFGDSVTLWEDNAMKRPDVGRTWANLAAEYLDRSKACPFRSPKGVELARKAEADYERAYRSPMSAGQGSAVAAGEAMVQAGELDEAQSYFGQLMTALPEEAADCHLWRARTRMLQKQLPGAKEDLQAVLAIRPQDRDGHFFLGLVCRGLDDLSEARRQFQIAHDIDPNFGPAQIELERTIKIQMQNSMQFPSSE